MLWHRGRTRISQIFSLMIIVSPRVLLGVMCAATATVCAVPSKLATYPIATLDEGTFVGKTANGTNMFLGIPFAQPPYVVDFGPALSSLNNCPNRQNWRPALPSAPGAWPPRRQTQCHYVQSFVPPASNYAYLSGRVSSRVDRRLIKPPWSRNHTCRRRRL
jgi:hypothetical protein